MNICRNLEKNKVYYFTKEIDDKNIVEFKAKFLYVTNDTLFVSSYCFQSSAQTDIDSENTIRTIPLKWITKIMDDDFIEVTHKSSYYDVSLEIIDIE